MSYKCQKTTRRILTPTCYRNLCYSDIRCIMSVPDVTGWQQPTSRSSTGRALLSWSGGGWRGDGMRWRERERRYLEQGLNGSSMAVVLPILFSRPQTVFPGPHGQMPTKLLAQICSGNWSLPLCKGTNIVLPREGPQDFPMGCSVCSNGTAASVGKDRIGLLVLQR